jgi:hypothetical protein
MFFFIAALYVSTVSTMPAFVVETKANKITNKQKLCLIREEIFCVFIMETLRLGRKDKTGNLIAECFIQQKTDKVNRNKFDVSMNGLM